jgi:CreA protein
MKYVLGLLLALLAFTGRDASAAQLECVDTAFKLLGRNHQVCVQVFEDPKIPNAVCHMSQARTGGLSGTFGIAEDPSEFSLACRQAGPIDLKVLDMKSGQEVFNERTSLVFKESRVVRIIDKPHKTLVYLVYSTKLIDGSPKNSISTIPIMPWPEK